MVSSAEPAKSAASDDALLDRFQKKGDRDALGELAQRYAGMVYGVARRQTGKAEAAEDVSQEVFMLFARRAGGFRNASAIGVWLMRTCRYVAANAMRAEMRRRRRERRAAVDPSGAAAPVEDRTWEELAPLLDAAIGRLGKEDHAAIFPGDEFAGSG
jgi:RNA polymerase sigma factor (sigma-70 family)